MVSAGMPGRLQETINMSELLSGSADAGVSGEGWPQYRSLLSFISKAYISPYVWRT